MADRDAQLSALANIVPQIMNAIGGGNPEISRQLAQQRAEFQEQSKQQNIKAFMRSVTANSTGEITPELIMEMATLHNVSPQDAMKVIGVFSQFRQQRQQKAGWVTNPDGSKTYQNLIPGQTTSAAMPTMPKQQGFTLSPGQQRFGADGQVIASVPGKPTPMPTGEWMVQPDGKGGYQKRYGVPKQGMTQPIIPKTPLVNNNVNMGNQKNPITEEANKAVGKQLGSTVTSIFQQAREARSQNVQLEQVALAIANGAETGMGQEFILNVKSLAKTMGFDTGDLSGQELIRKVSNEMALRLRNPESGLGLTGSTSNKDLQFLKDSVVGLARTPEGNKAIINAMLKFNRLKTDTAIKASQILESNGGSVPPNFNQQIMDFVNNYKLLDEFETEQIKDFLKNKGAAPPEAIEFLKKNPSMKDAFKEKYGYLPEGI